MAEKYTGKFRSKGNFYPDKPSPHLFPKSLPTVINIGLIVTEPVFTMDTVVKAFKNILKRLEKTLENTPARYRFVIPLRHGPEHEILAEILSDPLWERCSPAEVLLIEGEGLQGEQICSFEWNIPYETSKINLKKKTAGFDSVSDSIIQMSTLIVLIGEWEPDARDYREGSIFRLAKHHGTTIVAIHPNKVETYEIPHEDRIFESYNALNEYNREKISRKRYSEKIDKYIRILNSECKKAELSTEMVEPVYETFLPHFTRTKMLSLKYMRLYSLAGTMVSFLAAIAVFTITIQTIFFPDKPELVWLEVAEISLIIIFMTGSRYGGYHRKWIDYNFLSERIRAAFFLYVVHITCKTPDTPPHMSLAHRPNEWMVMAFESLIYEVSSPYCRLNIPFEPLKKFFLSAWINNRLGFYERESIRSGNKYLFLTIAGEALFSLTLIFAAVHALGIGHWELYNVEASMVLASVTITMPAFAAAIASVRVQREYLRNKERYSHIARHINSIKNEMYHVKNMNSLCSLLEEMNEITLREQQDWRILFRFRRIEPV